MLIAKLQNRKPSHSIVSSFGLVVLGIQSKICSVYIESNRNIIAAYMGVFECEMIDVNSDRNATKKKRVPLTSVIGLVGSVGW